MTTRTFKQFGIAYGSQPANITAKIDNVVVYQGPVTTVNSPFPTLPDIEFTVTNELFSWTTDVTFSGAQVIDITIDGNAELLIADIRGNYCPAIVNNQKVSSGPTGFEPVLSSQFGNTYINGTLQQVVHGDLPGQWWWKLPADGEFIENITMLPGLA